MALLKEIFTWWNGQTIGVRFWTWRKGEYVGVDDADNVYYRARNGLKDPALGFERRWVIYKNDVDSSQIPPGWHAWLHHRSDEVPSGKASYRPRSWEKPHLPNMTGTPEARSPAGSLHAPSPENRQTYAPWKP